MMLSFGFDHDWVLLVIFRWQFADYPVERVRIYEIGIVLFGFRQVLPGCWRQEV